MPIFLLLLTVTLPLSLPILLTCGGFDFDGVRFCVAFKVGVGAVKI
jgi:hypothetical protein